MTAAAVAATAATAATAAVAVADDDSSGDSDYVQLRERRERAD